MRTLLAAAAAFIFMILPATAQSWSFDSDVIAASVARSGASLHVACAGRGRIGVLYQVDQSRVAREVRGQRDTVFAFADRGGNGVVHTTIGVPLRFDAGKGYLAFYGDAASAIISRMRRAPSVVAAAIGVAGDDGYSLFNLTQFSASGSDAAIGKVIAACRR